MPLKPGTYQTRNSRVARLTEPFSRTKKLGDDSVVITGYRGDLMKADGKTVDSQHEWEDTIMPRVLGVLVRAGATEGVANEFDLISRIE